MKKLTLIPLLATVLATSALAGDPAVGKEKATACMACHGSANFGGIFYTLQLGGRDADKLTIKTMKYKTGKKIQPMMNMVTAFYTEKDIEDIAAYYKSLGKPFLTGPYIKIQGDDEAGVSQVSQAATPVSQPVSSGAYAASAWTRSGY
jgi:cytochrome c553